MFSFSMFYILFHLNPMIYQLSHQNSLESKVKKCLFC